MDPAHGHGVRGPAAEEALSRFPKHRFNVAALLAIAAALAPAVAIASPVPASADSPVSDVNPFVGTDAGASNYGTGGGAGNTFPGAVLPFGMVQFSPDTFPDLVNGGGGYTYSDHRIADFSLTHLSGPGCNVYQDIPFTPTTTPVTASPVQPDSINLKSQYIASYTHVGEQAHPGYYRVVLNPSAAPILSELTATLRTGVGRFSYPATSSAGMLINVGGSTMGVRQATVQIDPAQHEVTGSASSGSFCYQTNRYTIYFAARFSRPFAGYGTWREQQYNAGSTSASDTSAGNPFVYHSQIPFPAPGLSNGSSVTAQAGAYLRFDTTAQRSVEVRVGVSFVSAAQAERNLDAESAGLGFDQLRANAGHAWARALDRVTVAGGRLQDRRTFYTALYHVLIQPTTFSDVDGRYIGFDGNVHTVPSGHAQYANYSGWDVYRSQVELLALLFPHQAADMAQSLASDAAQSGALPKWAVANGHTDVMVGDPADGMIAGIHAFGGQDFDARSALQSMVQHATQLSSATNGVYVERPGLDAYERLGYVPHEENADSVTSTFNPALPWGSVSTTLEYATADFSIAQLAQALCDRSTYATFMRRSGNWRNLFDAATASIEPRSASGAFEAVAGTDGEDFVEGDQAQYTWAVPQDPAGLFAAMGKSSAAGRLVRFFTQLNAGPAAPYAFLGNEPTLAMPWLFDWLGAPYRTQDIVRRAILTLYGDRPGGFPGNDDLGEMSSWVVFGDLGLYPAVPGASLLALDSPLFPSATIRLGHGELRIRASGASPTSPYVQALSVDGRPFQRTWLGYADIAHGATLTFRLSSRPDAAWGAAPSDAPPSFPASEQIACGAPLRALTASATPAPALRLIVRPAVARIGHPRKFTFHVTARSGSVPVPVGGAQIVFAGRRARTGASGIATVIATIRSPGSLHARATKGGYRAGRATVHLLRPVRFTG